MNDDEIAAIQASARRMPEDRQRRIVATALEMAERGGEVTSDADLRIYWMAEALIDDGVEPLYPEDRPVAHGPKPGKPRELRRPRTWLTRYPTTCHKCAKRMPPGTWVITLRQGQHRHYPGCP